MESPGYYAVIPAHVRYCKSLPPAAKLLYGEITALCNKYGYCWATNKYFAELYEKDENTISAWVGLLRDQNFIHVEILMEGIQRKRKIWINDGFQKMFATPEKNGDVPRKIGIRTQEKMEYNNTPNTTQNRVTYMSEVQAPADVSPPPPPKEFPKEAKEIAQEIFSKAKEIYPKVKVPKFEEWERILDLINRRDGKSWDEIREMLKWAWESDFWVKQIRSPDSLRKHWDKMASQKSPYSNKSINAKRNRMIAQEVKDFLNKTDRGNLLWIGGDFVTNKEIGETVNLDIPSETLEMILCTWFKLKKV